MLMAVEDEAQLMEALEEDQDAVFEVLAEGIANSIEGVEPENVEVFDVQISQEVRRRLAEAEASARRLASSLEVSYVIHLDATEAYTAGVTSESVSTQIQSEGAAEIARAFVSNSAGVDFNFTLVIQTIDAPVPLEEVVDVASVPIRGTRTRTTTGMGIVAPLDDAEGGAVVTSVGIFVAIFIAVLMLIACNIYCMSKRKRKVEVPNFQTVEGDSNAHQMVLEVHDADLPQDAASPSGVAVNITEQLDADITEQLDFKEELGTPVLPDGTEVEYYSKTQSAWLPGKLKVVLTPGTFVQEPDVSYHVQLHTRGERERGGLALS